MVVDLGCMLGKYLETASTKAQWKITVRPVIASIYKQSIIFSKVKGIYDCICSASCLLRSWTSGVCALTPNFHNCFVNWGKNGSDFHTNFLSVDPPATHTHMQQTMAKVLSVKLKILLSFREYIFFSSAVEALGLRLSTWNFHQQTWGIMLHKEVLSAIISRSISVSLNLNACWNFLYWLLGSMLSINLNKHESKRPADCQCADTVVLAKEWVCTRWFSANSQKTKKGTKGLRILDGVYIMRANIYARVQRVYCSK